MLGKWFHLNRGPSHWQSCPHGQGYQPTEAPYESVQQGEEVTDRALALPNTEGVFQS